MAILCDIAEPVLDDNGDIANFPVDNNNSASLKSKQKVTGKTADGGKKKCRNNDVIKTFK